MSLLGLIFAVYLTGLPLAWVWFDRELAKDEVEHIGPDVGTTVTRIAVAFVLALGWPFFLPGSLIGRCMKGSGA